MKNNYKNKITQALINNFNCKNYELVISKSKSCIKKYPADIFFYNLLGSSYQNIGKQNEAISVFNQGLKIDPKNIHIYNNLGNSYKYLLKYKSAEKIFNQIIELNPKYTNAYINLGNLKRDINHFIEAINLYKKADEVSPNNYIILYLLALAYQGIGNFETAINYAKKVLVLNPKFTKADYLISQSMTYQNENWHYKELIQKIKLEKFTDEEKINLYFSLAKANEDLNKIENSFEFLVKGNSLNKKLSKYDLNKDKMLFRNIKKAFKNLDLEFSIQDNSHKIIFILGMPRSGTSLVEQILSAHDKVIGGGEMPILSHIAKKYFLYDKTNINKFDELIFKKQEIVNEYIKYVNYFDIGKNYITDKSLLNFFWIGYIKFLFPNSKIIHCTRDSKNNCLSMYKNLFENNLQFTYNEDDLIQFYKMYKDLMNFWENEKKINLIKVNYEYLINNKDTEIRRIINECGLDWDKNCLFHFKNQNPIKTMSTAQARRPIYKTSINSFDKYKKLLPKIDNNL